MKNIIFEKRTKGKLYLTVLGLLYMCDEDGQIQQSRAISNLNFGAKLLAFNLTNVYLDTGILFTEENF